MLSGKHNAVYAVEDYVVAFEVLGSFCIYPPLVLAHLLHFWPDNKQA